MPEPMGERGFEAFGVGIVVESSDSSLLERVAAEMPYGFRPRDPRPNERRFLLATTEGGQFVVLGDGCRLQSPLGLDGALVVLRAHAFWHVLSHAPGLIFVHAGAAAHNGRAILLPGGTSQGKSTLVAALLRAGATYYADDYVPIGPDGRVHPNTGPLVVADVESGQSVARSPHEFGGRIGEFPVAVGIIALLTYRAGASLRTTPRSRADGVMSLVANTVGAASRGAFALQAARAAAGKAVVLEGERGEAEKAASYLLEQVALLPTARASAR